MNIKEIIGSKRKLQDTVTSIQLELKVYEKEALERMVAQSNEGDGETQRDEYGNSATIANDIDFVISQFTKRMIADFLEFEEKERAAAERERKRLAEEEEAEKRRQQVTSMPVAGEAEGRRGRSPRAA